MSDSGQAVQQAVFTSINDNPDLAHLFKPVAGGRAELPRVDFDGLETRPHAGGVTGLFRHEISFLVWSDFYQMADGLKVFDDIKKTFDGVELTLDGHRCVDCRFTGMKAGRAKADRVWQIVVQFDCVTEEDAS